MLIILILIFFFFLIRRQTYFIPYQDHSFFTTLHQVSRELIPPWFTTATQSIVLNLETHSQTLPRDFMESFRLHVPRTWNLISKWIRNDRTCTRNLVFDSRTSYFTVTRLHNARIKINVLHTHLMCLCWTNKY